MQSINNEIMEAQCFFRHIHDTKKYNKTVSRLSDTQKQFWKKITYFNGRIPTPKIEKIHKMINQVNKLIIKMIPLYQVGFRWNIYLAGGSLRDLLLSDGEKIKDLDVIFSIESDSIEQVLEKTPLLTIESILGNEFHQLVNWMDDSDTQKVHRLFKHCISKNYTTQKAFTIEDIESKGVKDAYGNILNRQLEGIITIQDPSETEYPMDILLVNSSIDEYLKTFSFEICKAFVPFFTQSEPKMITNAFEFLEQINVTEGFIKDGMDKTITMDMFNLKHIEKIQKALESHYPRIANKFSDHKLILNPGKNEEYAKWKETYEMHAHLNSVIPHKGVTISSLPQKLKV